MRRLILCCALLAMAFTAPGQADDLVTLGPGGLEGIVQSFCEDPDIKDLVTPDGVIGLAASECFGGSANGVFQTERFVGDGESIVGVGSWWVMQGGLPEIPALNVRIYTTDAAGCPGDLLFECRATNVDVGPGTGTNEDPIEYYVDFAANDCEPFVKEDGVEYSISIANANCPGPNGENAFWASGLGDGLFGCIIAVDFGIPNWTPKAEAGYAWDNAMYLCNGVPPIAAQQSTWGTIKSTYK